MKGLLLKEFYNLKYYCLIYYLVDIFVFLIYLFATFYGLNNLGGKSGSMSLTESMGFLFNNSVASVTYLLFFSSFLMNVSYEIDEKNNVTKFLIGTGVSKKDIVTSKLIVGFAAYALPFLLLIVISFSPLFVSNLSSYYGVEKIISTFLIFLGSCLLNIGVSLSISSYLDFVKARLVSTFVTLIIIAIEVLMYAFAIFYDSPTLDLPKFAVYIFSGIYFLIVSLISIILYIASINQYEKKEF